MSESKSRTIPVSENGRMNLPADMRRALGLSGAGHLMATLVGDEIRITTARHALTRVRELAVPYKPAGEFASDRLIAARRDEARCEEDEIRGDELG